MKPVHYSVLSERFFGGGSTSPSQNMHGSLEEARFRQADTQFSVAGRFRDRTWTQQGAPRRQVWPSYWGVQNIARIETIAGLGVMPQVANNFSISGRLNPKTYPKCLHFVWPGLGKTKIRRSPRFCICFGIVGRPNIT